ncbi:hypothetical protein KVR01_000829 [Diaporthe batatas]|uniref:uncharacterized protein n=1 Tax=Diaporthe batatas TaxID=748121 RepID=UPI001D040F76|nr:uncharacterized protein KVR01_000829 [Diaporthe batatas]KAG8170084.1 hypothetical protein KVR01_000829 [Diaporthe batatas]
MPYIPVIISTIGALTLFFAAIKVARLGTTYFLPSRLNKYAHTDSGGRAPWALVTGASAGIGRALALELSSRGFNVVLHGRNHTKLSLVLAELQKICPERSFRILTADASKVPCLNCIALQDQQEKHTVDGIGQGVPDFTAIAAAVDDLHLTVLINNAGGSPVNPICAPLSQSSAARITDNVSLNALFPLHLTRVLLPKLIKSSPALVMNISSMADPGLPLMASYSASKQFLMNMTRSVRLEMALQGGAADEVELLGVRVGRVTGVSGCREPPSLFVPDATTMARAALQQVGRGHGLVIGYWAHALQQLGSSLLPAWAEDKVFLAVMRQEAAREVGVKRA